MIQLQYMPNETQIKAKLETGELDLFFVEFVYFSLERDVSHFDLQNIGDKFRPFCFEARQLSTSLCL